MTGILKTMFLIKHERLLDTCVRRCHSTWVISGQAIVRSACVSALVLIAQRVFTAVLGGNFGMPVGYWNRARLGGFIGLVIFTIAICGQLATAYAADGGCGPDCQEQDCQDCGVCLPNCHACPCSMPLVRLPEPVEFPALFRTISSSTRVVRPPLSPPIRSIHEIFRPPIG